jgi:hypothetical protein
VNQKRQLAMKVAAAVALVALGGVAGFALNANQGSAETATHKPPPVEVRTQVIRHTVRIHRKPKPAKQPPRPAGPPPTAPAPQVVAAAPPQPVAAPRAVAPVRAHAPIRTRTSGGGGSGGGEHEHEHEGSDD